MGWGVFSLASPQLADNSPPRLGPLNQVLPFLPHQRKALEKALLAREVGGRLFSRIREQSEGGAHLSNASFEASVDSYPFSAV